MKCEKIIQDFLQQEECRYPSFMIRMHTILCSSCRKEIRRLQKIFTNARSVSPFVIPGDMSNLVMRKIFNSDSMIRDNAVFSRNISPSKWFYSGAILFSSIILVSYSESFSRLKVSLGSAIEIPLNIVLGLAITIYAASYIGTHIEELKRIAEFINHKMH
jgi:hypothetical protein